MPEPASETARAARCRSSARSTHWSTPICVELSGMPGVFSLTGYTFCRAGVPRSPLGRTSITPIRIPKTTRSETLPFR